MTDRHLLITGANRGIGFGLSARLAEKGAVVFAAARDPKKSDELSRLQKKYPNLVHPIQLDVESDDSVRKAFDDIRMKTDKLDVIVNNAGRFGHRDIGSLKEIVLDEIRKSFEVNTIGPLRVSAEFLPLLKKGKEKKLIHMTSLMGSIDDNRSGSCYDYRLSKAALNMLARNLAVDLKKDGIISVAVHPGWVQTEMGGKNAPMTLDRSVSELIALIDGLTPAQSGQFLNYDGKELPF